MKYKALVTGNNNTIIDDFFIQMSDDLEVLSCSERYGDITRHIKYFVPDVFVFCLYNEDPDSIKQMVNIKPMLKSSRTPVVIIGNKDDCVEFNRLAYDVSDMDIMRPFTANSIRDKIVRYLNQKQAMDEEIGRKQETRAEDLDTNPKDDFDLDSLKNAISSLGAALNQQDDVPVQRADNNAPVKTDAVNAPTPQASSQPNAVNAPKPQAPASFGDNRHILVVDDDPIMLKTVKEQLHDDYDVATAISGKIAMKFLERKKTDLILLDYEMPGENGPDVLAKIRDNEATKNIPVVFLTGVSDKDKIQEAIALKPQGYLLKPIDHDKLMDVINRYVR